MHATVLYQQLLGGALGYAVKSLGVAHGIFGQHDIGVTIHKPAAYKIEFYIWQSACVFQHTHQSHEVGVDVYVGIPRWMMIVRGAYEVQYLGARGCDVIALIDHALMPLLVHRADVSVATQEVYQSRITCSM